MARQGDIKGRTVFLAGPTASGKSELAKHLALLIDAEIVGADAYQVYRGMKILTAAPEPFLDGTPIPHHLTGIIPVQEAWNASDHYRRASVVIADIHRRGRTAIVVGGSGLYLKFLTHGMSEAPPADEELRKGFARRELADLVEELAKRDPEGAAMTDCGNRRYVERNLEIVILGGRPLASWKSNWNREPAGPGWVLDWPVPALDERIAMRSRAMMDAGVLEEVAALGPCSATAERALGLAEVRSRLAGDIDRDECVRQITLATRRYAKRQRTWLRREQWMRKLEADPLSASFDLATQVQKALES